MELRHMLLLIAKTARETSDVLLNYANNANYNNYNNYANYNNYSNYSNYANYFFISTDNGV